MSAADTAVEPWRQALVIGVWNYAGADLAEMEADLHSVQKTFQGFGFDEVTVLRNPRQGEISDAVDRAAAFAAQAVDRAVLTVVYFGGHGTMVDHASYLLASDFQPPVDPSELIVSGGIACDWLAGKLAASGQPALLIVEACRNPLVLAEDVTPGAHAAPARSRMISAPAIEGGYAAFYGQSPGRIVELAARTPGVPSPLVRALAEAAALTGSATPYFAEVRRRLAAATANQRHPYRPEYIDRGAGELHLRFDDIEREADQRRWQATRAQGSHELVRGFLAVFRTSRHVGAARRFLQQPDPEAARPAVGGHAPEDPSRSAAFWRGASVQAVTATPHQILAGRCLELEDLANDLLRPAQGERAGLVIASVFGQAARGETSAATFDRALAILARLRERGLPERRIALRTFSAAELPEARAPTLCRRRDSAAARANPK